MDRIKTPECCFTIGMSTHSEDDEHIGQARISVLKDGNIAGWFEKAAHDRNIAKNINVQSTDSNVGDFKWHHVVFTRYGDIYTLFIDGKVVVRKYVDDYVSFLGDKTLIHIFGHKLQGSAFVDDLIFLEIGLSVYEVKAIMEDGLDAFMQAMPVDPQEKASTTWGHIKQRNTK